MTNTEIKVLAEKLKGSAPLTESDIVLLRNLIVGDAESYVHTENSVPDWKKELQRVMGEISRYSGHHLSVPEVLKLQALLRDADRVVDDISFYAAQKNRVAKFDSAINQLTMDDRELLFALLNTRLQSKYF